MPATTTDPLHGIAKRTIIVKLPIFALAASVALLAPGAALAQAAPPAASAPALQVGTVVYGPQGAEVGKISGIANDVITVDTGASKAGLPRSAFGSGSKGPTITVTKAQIDAQVAAALQQSAAALTAALVPGAQVHGKSGALVGTIKELRGDQVVIDRPAGPISLPRNTFATGPQGLTISVTAAELEAAAKSAAAGT